MNASTGLANDLCGRSGTLQAPEQSGFEWDFPGLAFFSASNSASGGTLFDDLLIGNDVNVRESLFLGMLS